MLEQKDLDLLKQKGIAPATVEAQLARFTTGFPYLRLKASAKVGEGIMQLSGSQQDLAVDLSLIHI